MAKVKHVCGYTLSSGGRGNCTKHNNIHICARVLEFDEEDLKQIRRTRDDSPHFYCKSHKCKCGRLFG